MGRAKRPRLVEYPNGMRVTVMQSKTFLDTYTGVVVDYDIVHGTVSPRVNEPGSMAGLRLPSLAATGTRTRRPTNSVGGRRVKWEDIPRSSRLMADGKFTEWVPTNHIRRQRV